MYLFCAYVNYIWKCDKTLSASIKKQISIALQMYDLCIDYKLLK